MTKFVHRVGAQNILFFSVFLLILGLGMLRDSKVSAMPLGASTGPTYGTASSFAWQNPNLASGPEDNHCATKPTGTIVAVIQIFNIPFSIPTGSTITGILVESKNGDDTALNWTVQLVKTGSLVGTPKPLTPTITSSCSQTTFASLGGAGDLWGTTWTPSDFTPSNFAVRITTSTSSADTGLLDAVRITVFYDPPAPSPKEVPEADTLLLFSSGLGGLATWVGWQMKKVNSRQSTVNSK